MARRSRRLPNTRSSLQSTQFDLVVFSPPYPNSFDYTDIYNVELWALGYLGSSADNRKLRGETLRSHVQIRRAYESANGHSPKLVQTLKGMGDSLFGDEKKPGSGS